MSEGNGFAGRELFIRKAPRRYREILVPEFGKVRLQSLTEGEKSRYEASVLSHKGGLNRNKLLEARRRLIVLCVVDAEGNRLLRDNDADTLQQLDGAVASAIFDACQEHCGFDKDDVEELVKNSERIPVEGSP